LSNASFAARTRGRFLLVLAAVGLAAVVAGNFFPGSWVVASGWSFYVGVCLTVTCPCVFSVLNPKYRTVIWTSGIYTLPALLMIVGPLMVILSSPIGYALPLVAPYGDVVGFVLFLTGVMASFVELAVLVVCWRQSKYIAEYMTPEGKWPREKAPETN
jgi:hypothetical protein